MKKIYSLSMILLSLFMTIQLDAQNLLSGWDGNGITGDLSKPNDVGWLNTVSASIPWSIANAGGGCRFRDAGVGFTAGTFTNEADGSVNDARHLMLRYDGGAYSSSVYAYPVILQANTTYEFSMDFICGGSATPPKNMIIGASKTPNLDSLISAQTITSTSTTTVFRKVSYTFTSSAAGTYYMTFRGDWAWFAITNLNLVKNTVQLTELNNQYTALTLGDISAVTSDLILPTVLGTQGVTATWKSSNNVIVDSLGHITRPEKYNRVVTLTATLSQNIADSIYSITKSFNVTVLGLIPTPVEVAQWNFGSDAITFNNGVIQVADTKSGFIGIMKNEARIRTIGTTQQFNVLDLGNGTGYFDMGTEIGKAIYSLTNYTMCGYFRIDDTYPYLNSNGNFYWTFSNSDNIDTDKNGYIIASLKAQGVSVADYYNLNNTAINVNANAGKGNWHHFAYVQNGNTGTVYIDGTQAAQNVQMTSIPAFLLPKAGLNGTNFNWLGRSNYKNDVYLRQTLLYDFRVYSEPLSESDLNWDVVNVNETLGLLNTAYSENPDFIINELVTEKDNLNLGDVSAVTSNLTLPTKGTLDPAISISWKSFSNLIAADGTITRPDYFNYTDTLTATLFKNGQFITRKFPVTLVANAGTTFNSDLLVKFDFSQFADTIVTDVAEKHFQGVARNNSKIMTMGLTTPYKVLNLGDSIGYFDMGQEMGKLMYNLQDYTLSTYYRVDTAYHSTEIEKNGNFLWNIANSKDILSDPTGYIIGKLKNHGLSITPTNWSREQGVTPTPTAPALSGNWHNFTYTQSGTTGTVYIDGMPMATDTVTMVPSNTLRVPGRIGTLYNWIGRSSYKGDVYLRKTLVYDFRLYKKALSESEIQTSELNVGATIEALDKAYAEGLTGLADLRESGYQIASYNREIHITGLNGTEKISIYDITGRQMNRSNVRTSSFKVGTGIYIVRINNFATKVVVK
ncbi:MAG: immunoglobulin-like domain-containing protein [Paludibacteraceae bacterium]